MRFSVLIPMYNAERYISECINSILNQDYQDYEIIIVDDGSTDNSSDIVDSYQAQYPKKIRVIHKDNSGVLLTRRRAIQEAKGDYILWVDADDVIKPSLMRVLHGRICLNNADIIIYNYELLDKPETTICSLDPEYDCQCVDKHLICTKLILGRNMNELWTKCIRREIYDINADYSSYKHVRMGDDVFCLLPVINEAEKIEYINESFYRYRLVKSSITHTIDYNSYFSYRSIYERECEFIDRWNFSDDEKFQAKIIFSTKIISFILQGISLCKDKKDYDSFVRRISEDEKRRPICLQDNKGIKNTKMRFCYGLWKAEKYEILYYFGKMMIFFSNLKNR